jgi:homoaconitate hydratase
MKQNLIEKIATRYALGIDKSQGLKSGDIIMIQPAHVLTHDNTGAVIPKFQSIGAKNMVNPRQPVFALDHNVQDKSEKNLEKYAKIEAFAKAMGVDFYPAGRGIGHQIMCEEGYIFPGTMVVASDSHSNMYGGLGCLGTPIVRTDAAGIWATGKTWWQVPPITRVRFTGTQNPGVTGKDLIIVLAGYLNHDEVLNHAIEFTGEGVASLSIESRLAIANMTTEWGALAGVFPIDDMAVAWLKKQRTHLLQRGKSGVPSDIDWQDDHPRLSAARIAALEAERLSADPDADYFQTITIDLSSIEPHISGPDTVKIAAPVAQLQAQKIHIDKAYLLSCVNGRVEDLAEAAAILKGKKIADHVKFYLAAASSEVQKESEARGDWQILLDAGAIVLPPGCGPCIGMGAGLLEDGEIGISATNRNFKGRMGSRQAKAYLASPAVVAASALKGFIAAPFDIKSKKIQFAIEKHLQTERETKETPILEGFPAAITGRLLFCPGDNLNTDGIYAGKHTYNDDMSPADQAAVVMENYDPEFRKVMKAGDILAGGFNFGTGSSREQAATALKYAGIQLVIAGSFSETYKRNAINNGFLPLEIPKLIEKLCSEFPQKVPTINTETEINLDFRKSQLSSPWGKFHFAAVGEAAQELIIAGGLENWIRKQL